MLLVKHLTESSESLMCLCSETSVFTQGRRHCAVMGKSKAVTKPSAHPRKRNDVGKYDMPKPTSLSSKVGFLVQEPQ